MPEDLVVFVALTCNQHKVVRLRLRDCIVNRGAAIQLDAMRPRSDPGDDAFRALADAILKDARGQGDNNFKIPMAHRAIVRAPGQAARGTPAELTDVAGRPDLEDTP